MHLAISRAQAAVPPMPFTGAHTLSLCTKGHFLLSPNTALGWGGINTFLFPLL